MQFLLKFLKYIDLICRKMKQYISRKTKSKTGELKYLKGLFLISVDIFHVLEDNNCGFFVKKNCERNFKLCQSDQNGIALNIRKFLVNFLFILNSVEIIFSFSFLSNKIDTLHVACCFFGTMLYITYLSIVSMPYPFFLVSVKVTI